MAIRATRSSVAREAAFLKSEDAQPGNEQKQVSSATATPAPAKKSGRGKAAQQKADSSIKAEDRSTNSASTANATSRKRKRDVKKEEEDHNDDEEMLPHGLGMAKKLHSPKGSPLNRETAEARSVKDEASTARSVNVTDTYTAGENSQNETKKKRAKKNNKYGLTPGQTPFPDYPRPTPEECWETHRLLSQAHGEHKAPAALPPPSMTFAGCGEVPSVLDAMIRTYLSAATNSRNSGNAIAGLYKNFDTIKEGIGAGSIDWNQVRLAPYEDVVEAIKRGGLARSKAKNIQATLQMVYEENQQRRAQLLKQRELEKGTGDHNEAAIGSVSGQGADSKSNSKDESTQETASGPRGVENEDLGEQNLEIAKADKNILSLDHLHLLDTHSAMNAMMRYPGVAVKTAACVCMFNMRRPVFAVDTHVFRLSKYLGWVPVEKATRDKAFSHLEVRVPDELKYSLHQLFIKHGKKCARCKGGAGQGEAWDAEKCPIEHLVKRTEKDKSGSGVRVASPAKKATPKKGGPKGEGRKAKEDEGSDVEDSMSELSDVQSDADMQDGESSEASTKKYKKNKKKDETPRKRLSATKKTPSRKAKSRAAEVMRDAATTSESSELSEPPSDADTDQG